MCSLPPWLPDLIRLEDHGNDWQRYIDAVYARFNADFIVSRPCLFGLPVYVKADLTDGKERTFWHIVQEGPAEPHRIPALRRCERLTWIRPILEHVHDSAVLHWLTERGGRQRQLLFLVPGDYLVVLERRRRYYILWTAYDVVPHRKRKLLQEYERWEKSRRRP